MVKKEGKKASTPLVEKLVSEPAIFDEKPWWEEEFRNKRLEVDAFTYHVYVVREGSERDADLLSMLVSAIRSGVRRKFAVLEHDEVLKIVPDVKKPAIDQKSKVGTNANKREQPVNQPPVGVPPEQGMLAAMAEVLRVAGQLDAVSMAMVVKHALSLLLKNRRTAAGAEGLLPMPTSSEPPGAGKATKKKDVPAGKKKKKPSAKSEKATPADDKSTEKDKDAEKEDGEFEAFCESRSSMLRKRGEAQEPAYKDDEPPDGPDLYVLMAGFRDPRLPRELAACGVHVEAIVRLVSEQCHVQGSAAAVGAAFDDEACRFWSELPVQLAADSSRLKDTAVTEVIVDRCQVRYAPSLADSADHVYTAVARELYRYLLLRALFERYTQSVSAVPVPNALRPPPPQPRNEQEAAPPVPAESLSLPVPETEPCVREPAEYRRLLAPLPPEAVTVPLLVNALVEQVCVWALPFRPGQQEPVSEPTSAEPSREPSWEDLEQRVSLKEEFGPRPDDTRRGPVLVYERDAVNAVFHDWTDLEPVLSAEHALTQAVEVQALQSRPPAPVAALWRHQAACEELRTVEGGTNSDLAAELLLRQLLFESLYAVLTPDIDNGVPMPYPHPFLPVQSVRPDSQRLAPECGHGQLAADAALLDTRDQLMTPEPRFAEFRVCERLDRLTMAQVLESARDGRRCLAAYHFNGDDGLYLVYGHPRVRCGSLSDHWQQRVHTAIGLRDFAEHVQHWPDVRAWMERQHCQIPASMPRPAQSSRPDSAVVSVMTPPIEAPLPGSGIQLPDTAFLVPGSLKHEASLQQQRGEEPPRDGIIQSGPPPAANKRNDKKRKESRRRSSEKSARKDSAKGQKGEADGSPPPPLPPQTAAISVVQFEIRPKSPDTSARQRSPSPGPPPKVFVGYSVSLGRLLDVRGSGQRQYFSDGSYLTVRRSHYVHGPTALVVSVRRGETRLTLHPGDERHDLVAVLPGGVLLHPQIALRDPPPPPPPPPESPAAPPVDEQPALAPQPRKSVRYRSPPEKGKKKEAKKEKKPEPKRASGKKRQPSVEEEPLPLVPEESPDQPTEECVERPASGRRVQTLRLSCPSGLVVELQPEPFWSCPEPRLRVVQYYVGADCERRRVRVSLSDGSLLLLHGDGQPEDEVLLLGADGGQTTCRYSEDGLVPLRVVSGGGRRRSWASDAPAEGRQLLTKMATDPVTRELFLQREDGARAVVRPGGQAVLQMPDGTRLTQTPPQSPGPGHAEPRPPGCSDYLVNETGWIGAPTVSWLLGAHVTVDDTASARRTVMTEHPMYARVEMDQQAERCRVRLPQGLLVEADSAGFYYVSLPDGSRLQLDDQVACFSGPGDAERRPVVHTLRLAAPEPPPEAAEPPPTSLCETVESDGGVWHVAPDGRLEPVGARPEPLPDPLPLQLRRQIDSETVMPEPPRLFVLYRHGDGVQLLSSSEAEAHLECVRRTPGALLIREPHQRDAELSVVKTFRPVGRSLAERWRMPYTESTIIPPNLRCRDLQLLCRGAAPPAAGAVIWGGGDPVASSPSQSPPPRPLPSGLVCTRELLMSPPLSEQQRLAVLRAVNELRLRWPADSADIHQLPTPEPPLKRVHHVYEPDRLLSWLSTVTAVSPAPTQEGPRHRPQHRAPSAGADSCKLDKILIYREMLRRRRFPAFFLTAEGRQFLSTLRQTPAEGRPAAVRRRLEEEPPQLPPPARPAPQLPPVGSGAVSCRPPRLDLGLVRPDRPVCAELLLCSSANTPLEFRVTPPGPPVGVRVRPERGLVPAAGQAALRLQLTPSAEVRSRSVFCLLEVVLDGGAQRLWVPVVACVAGGGAGQVLSQEISGVARLAVE